MHPTLREIYGSLPLHIIWKDSFSIMIKGPEMFDWKENSVMRKSTRKLHFYCNPKNANGITFQMS